MKLTSGDRTFANIGGGEAIAYEVSDSAEFMSLLSDGIYADCPRAIVRELANNASDSHAVAGQDKSVEITLPTHESPVFKIRDFGTGLSKAEMEKLYQTYGLSNKNKMNEANGQVVTGCMGIGSKSPFSYADAFTSISYYNGTAYVYCNAKNDMGEPQLIPQGEYPTDQPNGLEISFPVKEKDFNSFKQACRVALRPFKNRPKVVTKDAEFSISDYSFNFQGKGWGIQGGDSLAVMAQVEYPIDPDYFGDKDYDPDDYYSKKNKYQVLLNQGLVIEFGPGEVMFNMSREALKYRPYTVKNIRRRLDEILEELEAMITERFAECKTLWEARMLYQNLTHGEFRFLSGILNKIPCDFNGVDLRDATISVDKIDGLTISRFQKEYRRIHPKRRDGVTTVRVEENDKILFYVDDTNRGAFSACMRAIRDDGLCDVIYLLKGEDKAIQEFLERVGTEKSELHYISSLPKPERRTYERNKEFAYEFNTLAGISKPYGREGRARWWKPTELDLDDGGVYVEINNYEVVGIGHPCYLVGKIDSLMQAGIKVPAVYGIKTAKLKNFQEDDNWTSFQDWAKEQLEETIIKEGLQDALNAVHTAKSYERLPYMTSLAKKVVADEKSPAKCFFDALLSVETEYNGVKSKVDGLQSAATRFGYNMNPSLTVDLKSLEKDFYDQYPMVSLAGNGMLNTSDYPKIADYISLMDSI